MFSFEIQEKGNKLKILIFYFLIEIKLNLDFYFQINI